jgi:Immunity protein 63
MSFFSLSEIENSVNRLAGRIAAPANLLPTFGYSEDFARPHIEVDARGYHFVVVERGQELERRTTDNLDDLLSRIFTSVTFSMACNYELRHRVDGADPRRLLFATQVDLLSRLSSDWARREVEHHEIILRTHPFSDAGEEIR